MKKYRFTNPSQQSALQRSRPYILLFVGWNLIGVLAWKFVSIQAKESDPMWESKSEAEQIAAVYGKDVVKHKITFGKKDEDGTRTSS